MAVLTEMCINGIMAQGDYGGKAPCALPASLETGYEIRMGSKVVEWRVSGFQRFEGSILEKGQRQI